MSYDRGFNIPTSQLQKQRSSLNEHQIIVFKGKCGTWLTTKHRVEFADKKKKKNYHLSFSGI